MTWTNYADEHWNVHVVPAADLIEHELTDECACGVTTEPCPRDDGTVGWLWTHHSLDGREHIEKPTP